MCNSDSNSDCDAERPTSLEHWTACRLYIQRLIEKEPDCAVLQGELEGADRKLAEIANGTYKRSENFFFVIQA